MKIFTTLILTISLAVLLVRAHLRSETPKDYYVVLNVIPPRITPREIKVNTDFMILSHIFYPLFSVTEDGQIESEFLDMEHTAALDQRFDRYKLCLRSAVSFSNGEKIRIEHVVKGIKDAASSVLDLPSLEFRSLDSNCSSLTLSDPEPKLLHKLATISATPLYDSEENIAIGLGPYQIETASSEKIVLTSNANREKGAFTKVHFLKFQSNLNIDNYWFVDTNHLSGKANSNTPEQDLQEIYRPSFKSYAVVVNYTGDEERKLFGACFNREAFIPILPMRLKRITGFFPEGALGSEKSWEAIRNASAKDCQTKEVPPVTFMYFDPEQERALKMFFAKFQKFLPIPVLIDQVRIDTFISEMYKSDNLAAVVGFDSIGEVLTADGDGMSYIEYFVANERSKRLVSNINPKLANLAKRIRVASDRVERRKLMSEAHAELMKSGQIIPLGELEAIQRYPKQISNIVWLGTGNLSGFPDVSKMQWQRNWLGN